MIPLPPQNRWTVTHDSEILGVLDGTQGANFDDEAFLSVGPKPATIYSSGDNSQFGLPLKILYFNSSYFIVTATDVWTLGSDLALTNITDGESNKVEPNNGSDAVVWQNRVYVSGDTTEDIRYWSGSAWTNPSIALSTSLTPHPLEVMGNFSNGHLVVGEDNTVKRYNTSHSLVATLTLNNDYTVTCLLYRQNNLYIGTKAANGGKAKLFVWNGSGTSAQQEYEVGSDWIFSIEEYGSSFVIVTNTGELLLWNGGGFNQLAVFPVYNSIYHWGSNISNLLGKVGMNGMVSDGDLLYININGAVGGTLTLGANSSTDSFFLPNQPSGVWCYDPKVGLYCRTTHSRDGFTSFTTSTLSSNTLTLSANTNAQTGDPVFCRENGSLTGISDDTTYYAIKVADNQIKLAKTPANAHAGSEITLGGAVTSAVFLILNYTQAGDTFQFREFPGGIGLVQSNSGSPPPIPDLFKTPYLWGFEDDDGVTRLCAETRSAGTALFTTVKAMATGIEDAWNKVYTLFKDFYGDSAKMVVRYRIEERQNLPTEALYGTYSNTTTIGSDDERLALAQDGDCVVIISGNGAGNIRTIKKVNGNELVLNEALTGVSVADDIVFYIDSFEELQAASSSDADCDFIESAIGENSPWVQFLIEARGTMKISGMRIVNAEYKATE